MKKELILLTGLLVLAGCQAAPKTPPTQVIYRFDDHRYLELVGFNCEGALWFTDTQRHIHSEVSSQFYRIFTKNYIHPSEKYIAITYYDISGVMVSKDYGRTWHNARFMPGGGAKRYGASSPEREDVVSFTVVNNQGFIQTKSGDLYMSSKPFDDPRLLPGGEGIPYTYKDVHNNPKNARLMPGSSGLDWGRQYISWNAVNDKKPWSIFAWKPNWQNIPNQVPDVKNYKGWDRMQCNPDLGLSTAEPGK
ncbi:T6SS immunity protein Tli3 family protein [Type-D symbiont of Plautia stali]|uniref:T6SS immunity protein Tli3 family protein n=1 Tax=Type-D symbiont of Plautia stali TaxID=1560356 RepID=UPI0009E8A417|nr:hypothetical protein [Type-D symbiont of Plautia stali]